MEHEIKNKRKYFTVTRKREILRELKLEGMTVSLLARKYDIHPVTIHQWRRIFDAVKDKSSSEEFLLRELLEENKVIKQENESLRKAFGDFALKNSVFQEECERLKGKLRAKLCSHKRKTKSKKIRKGKVMKKSKEIKSSSQEALIKKLIRENKTLSKENKKLGENTKKLKKELKNVSDERTIFKLANDVLKKKYKSQKSK